VPVVEASTHVGGSTTVARALSTLRSDGWASRQSAYNPLLRPGKKMRVIQKAFTFDDVLLIPAHSTVVPREVSLTTRLTRTLSLNIPLLSAAMDTVTESRLAIAMAQEGGLGIIHKNMPAAMQASEVAK
jgi:hypothetical protein